MSTITGARQGTDNLAIATGYGVLDRDYRKQLGLKVPKYKALSIMRELEGRMTPYEKTINHAPYFYEEGDWFNAAFTIAVADVSTPNQVTVTASAADHMDTGTKTYPLVNDLVVFEDETTGFIYSVNRASANAHTFLIKPTNASQLVQTAAVVGTKIVSYGSLFGEASDTPETRTPFVSKITNTIHTSRDAYKVTDYSMQSEVEFEWNGQKFLFIKGIDEMTERFSMKEELNLILTQQVDTLSDAGGAALKSASGLIPQITSNGQSVEYFDDPDLAFFQDTVLTMVDNYGDDEYFVGMGINFSLGTDNWLNDFNKYSNTGISYNAFDGGQGQAVKFDFRSIALGGATLHFQTWPILSHKGSLGAGEMPYRHMAIMIPTGTGLDDQRNKVPYMHLRYSPPQGAPHEVQGDIKVFEHGGASRRGATNGVQQRYIEMISYKTLEVRNREKFVIARKGNL